MTPEQGGEQARRRHDAEIHCGRRGAKVQNGREVYPGEGQNQSASRSGQATRAEQDLETIWQPRDGYCRCHVNFFPSTIRI
jgi:hypothetical protein